MSHSSSRLGYALAAFGLFACCTQAAAQDNQPPTAQQAPAAHEQSAAPARWMWMNDGAGFLTFNHQGGDRGKTELKSQNWFMTMVTRRAGPGQLTLKGMFSADVLTQTSRGYSELFQMGEAYRGLENIDYQHPHDLFMQLAAVWRVPVSESTGITFSGGPVGEATLGPVAFMHRQSASEDPVAPLAHHMLDSTHIAEGVVATSVDHGPWVAEGSVFHGREPDQHRANLETGALDSWATRLWFRPTSSWMAQVSYGFLKAPEELEPGDVRRVTGSVSWTHTRGPDYLAITAAVGHNRRIFDTNTTGFLSEATLHRGDNSAYTRIEVMQVTSEHLLFPTVVHKPHPGELIDILGAYTMGVVHDLPAPGPMEVGLGTDLTFYSVPTRLQTSTQVTLYGAHPVSFHIFLRVRPRSPAMGHMWNTMMPGSAMSH